MHYSSFLIQNSSYSHRQEQQARRLAYSAIVRESGGPDPRSESSAESSAESGGDFYTEIKILQQKRKILPLKN